jgi:hypothetical protein
MKNLEEYVISPVLVIYREIQIIVILVALIATYLFVLIRLKFKIDFTGVLTLLLFLIATIIRVIYYFSKREDEDLIDIIED